MYSLPNYESYYSNLHVIFKFYFKIVSFMKIIILYCMYSKKEIL